MASPANAEKRAGPSIAGPSKKSRRSLELDDVEIVNILNDSGSDCEEYDTDSSASDSDDEDRTDRHLRDNVKLFRVSNRQLRDLTINENEGIPDEEVEGTEAEQEVSESGMNVSVVMTEANVIDGGAGESERDARTFTWSDDVSTFNGKREEYLRVPGPTFYSQDPTSIFEMVWDREIINRKIEKIKPILDHCNLKFSSMYTPCQELSLDESLLLWKGRLSWKQCIRSKAARFGIKTFELCEAQSGYLLQYRLYTGKRIDGHSDTLHGFQEHTAKVVLDLVEGYLDAGHTIVMDNWYNQLPLTRYLKTRRTDVLGTVNRLRQGMPQAIKNLNPNNVSRGTLVSRYSSDIALVAWMDVKLVTVISTYHQHSMVPGRRAGEAILKPIAVADYNRYMGGIDLKDQKLSMFLVERKRCRKWYIKVFKRLFNTSLLNAFHIYTRIPMQKLYSHREFRFKVAEGLISRYPLVRAGPSRAPRAVESSCIRLLPGEHFPVYTEVSGSRNEYKRLRCVRCYARKKRVTVKIVCELCKVPLCVGKCWREYHTMPDLK